MPQFLLVLTVALALLSAPAQRAAANAIYAYQGGLYTDIDDDSPPFGAYDGTMALTGSIELASPLAPDLFQLDLFAADLVSFSFNDGRVTITEANATNFGLTVTTDGSGTIVDWLLFVQSGSLNPAPRSIMQSFNAFTVDVVSIARCGFGESSCTTPSFLDQAIGASGSWSLVPEPATGTLLAGGLLGLTARRRRGGAERSTT